MDQLRTVLYGVLPAMAATLLLVGWRGPRWLGLCAGLGLLVSYGLLKNRFPAWPPLASPGNDLMLWTCWCALLAGAIAAAGGRRLRPAALPWALGTAGLAAMVWLMLTNFRGRWSAVETSLQVGVPALGIVAVWLSVRRAIADRGTAAQTWVLCGCLSADSALLLLSGSALQGQLAGAIAAAWGTAAGTALWRHPFRLDRAAALPFAAAHGGLLLAGLRLSELGLLPAILAALAPAALVLAGPQQPGARGLARPAMTLLVVALLLGGALAIALAHQP